MELLIMMFVTAANLILIIAKFRMGRYADTALDSAILYFMLGMFGNTLAGGMIATLASAMISLYLWFKPFTIKEVFTVTGSNTDEPNTQTTTTKTASAAPSKAEDEFWTLINN